MSTPPPCRRQQELMQEVQRHLIRIAELSREEIQVLETRDNTAWLEIDKQIEHELGEKERSLGALKEHQREHGC